jgi:4a-hydroxytetrahydrobiopterin dehydratase
MSAAKLRSEKCVAYGPGTPPLPGKESARLLRQLRGWKFTPGKKGIVKDYKMKDFVAAVGLIRKIMAIAQAQDHHPDLHLTSYRNLRVEYATHSIGGLSRNDFIMAAKTEALPKKLKR